jgi:ribosomal protein S18 acetylase RimI-like enzyme
MSPDELYATIEATWPPARSFRKGPWTLRDGQGGGKRVSAATAEGWVNAADIALMEAEQQALGQPLLAMIREGDEALDALLAMQDYEIVDPVVAYAAPVSRLAGPVPPASAFAHWPRLAVTEEIWAEAGIGPGRLAVMDRAPAPKCAVLGRTDDRPAGAAFVALYEKTAMIHAIEVRSRLRRRGTARNILRAAATWAQDVGATTFSLVVTERNTAARALYASLGMAVVGHYHYRTK